jgi:hypothetical protein
MQVDTEIQSKRRISRPGTDLIRGVQARTHSQIRRNRAKIQTDEMTHIKHALHAKKAANLINHRRVLWLLF